MKSLIKKCLTCDIGIEHELGEERVEFVVLHERLVVDAEHLVDEGQLLLQQHVVAEVPVELVPALSLRSHAILESDSNVIVYFCTFLRILE